ncbi:hypothetical protein [Streptomyces cinereoruber]|uniref:hypothetical protein n=1 Tax=Streptomyces cinereoruber TaxID=67260 RepID=UPI003644F8BF
MDLDRTPAEIARAASEQVRVLNHRTLRPSVFTYPSEVQDALTGLNGLLLGLPQAIDQIHGGLDDVRQKQDLYTHDANNDVDETMNFAKDELLDAIEHVKEAQLAIQNVVNRLAYIGARIPADEPVETV